MFVILKHFVPKKVNFPEGMGFFYHICGKSGGEGGLLFSRKNGKSENPGRWGGGGVLSELSSMDMDMDIFWNYTIYKKLTLKTFLKSSLVREKEL